jgi:hypothetical protein
MSSQLCFFTLEIGLFDEKKANAEDCSDRIQFYEKKRGGKKVQVPEHYRTQCVLSTFEGGPPSGMKIFGNFGKLCSCYAEGE